MMPDRGGEGDEAGLYKRYAPARRAYGSRCRAARLGLDLIGLVGNTEETGEIVQQAASTILGLRLLMTIIPIVLLAVALFFFNRKFILTDERAAQIAQELQARRAEQAQK